MSSNNSSNYSGPSFLSLLFLLFLALKLTGYIDWSWWWITAPLWGSAVLIVLVIALAIWSELAKGRRKGG